MGMGENCASASAPAPLNTLHGCSYVLKQGQHLRVGGVVRDGEAQVRVAQDGGDADQAGAAAGHDADVLPGVLALLALAVVLVVEAGDGGAQRLDAGRGAVLAGGGGDGDGAGAGEAAGDVVVGVGRALAQVGPLVRVLEVSVFAGTLRTPDDARRGARGVEAGMGTVALVGVAELPVRFRVELCGRSA
ncbi:hypothetical protein VTN02DRAFT_6000 [Thermoascus thermophilus]